ncbi:MAG TPA: hypothetical protein PK821_00610 [Victivallales bacterium]|nr:hypothetical protein [Victivallales bacterium]
MINPGWEDAILAAKKNLEPGGITAAVDFDGTRHKFFRNWMAVNHVRTEHHVGEFLNKNFKRRLFDRKKAYDGLWEYFLFVVEQGASGISSQP